MKPSLVVVTGMSAAFFGCVQGAAFDQRHALWSQVLSSYRTASGRVRYRDLKADVTRDTQHPFSTYLKELSSVPGKTFKTWNKNEQKAFLINAYNAFSIKLIVDKHPVRSIKAAAPFFSDPWRVEFLSLLDNQVRTLDQIEDTLMSEGKDARVHAALNCAGISCPLLAPAAFVPDKLDAQLDEKMRAFLNDPERNQYSPDQGEVHISKIFDWNQKDFAASFGGLKEMLQKFGPPEAQEALKRKGTIRYMSYSWDLNEAEK